MKKLFSFLTLAMVFVFASCMKEKVEEGSGDENTVRFVVNLPQQKTMSRALFENPTLEGKKMRVFLYVLYEGKIVSQVEETHDFGEGNFTAPVRLVTGKKYEVVAWADFGADYYSVSAENDKPTVTIAREQIEGCNNLYDAYFAVNKEVIFSQANETETLVLTRPFGLVTIKTNDYDEAAVVEAGLLPEKYVMTVSAPTQLDLLSGEISGEANVTITGVIQKVKENSGDLSFDYFFAPPVQARLNNMKVVYSNESDPNIVEYSFSSVPVQRNWKTNISGNVLTKEGSISVMIDQEWKEPDNQVEL